MTSFNTQVQGLITNEKAAWFVSFTEHIWHLSVRHATQHRFQAAGFIIYAFTLRKDVSLHLHLYVISLLSLMEYKSHLGMLFHCFTNKIKFDIGDALV